MAKKSTSKKSATKSGKKTATKPNTKRRSRNFGDTGPRQGGN